MFWFKYCWGYWRELGGRWNELCGGGWSWVEVEMSRVEVDGAGWGWVEADGAGWRWVHSLVIPDNLPWWALVHTVTWNFDHVILEDHMISAIPQSLWPLILKWWWLTLSGLLFIKSETKGYRLPAMCRCELSAVIARLMSKCLWSGWKW